MLSPSSIGKHPKPTKVKNTIEAAFARSYPIDSMQHVQHQTQLYENSLAQYLPSTVFDNSRAGFVKYLIDQKGYKILCGTQAPNLFKMAVVDFIKEDPDRHRFVRGTAAWLASIAQRKAGIIKSEDVKENSIRSRIITWLKTEDDRSCLIDDYHKTFCHWQAFGHLPTTGNPELVSSTRKPERVRSGRQPLYPEVELHCFHFVMEQFKFKRRVSRKILVRKALEVNPTFYGGRIPGKEDLFNHLTEKWYGRFIYRKGLRIRRVTSAGQKLPQGWEEICKQHSEDLLALRKNPEILAVHEQLSGIKVDILPLKYVFNADETPIPLEDPGSTTLAPVGAKHIPVATGGKEKQRITAMVTVSLDGTRKNLMIVFKGKAHSDEQRNHVNRNTVLYQLQHTPGMPTEDEVLLDCNNKAYMRGRELKLWVDYIFPGHPDSAKILILDDYACHWEEEFMEHLKSKGIFTFHIKGGLTPVFQVCDQAVNRLIKDNYREEYTNWVYGCDPTKPLKAPPRELAARWIVDGFSAIDPGVIIRSAVACGCCTISDFDHETIEKHKIMQVKPHNFLVSIVFGGGDNQPEPNEREILESVLDEPNALVVDRISEIPMNEDDPGLISSGDEESESEGNDEKGVVGEGSSEPQQIASEAEEGHPEKRMRVSTEKGKEFQEQIHRKRGRSKK